MKDFLNKLKYFEGCRLTAYKCAGGVWTIGYGHTAGVQEGDTCTEEQALHMLKDDVDAVIAKLSAWCRRYSVSLTLCQIFALTSFIYNVGFGAFSRSTLAKMVRDDANNLLIAKQFARWIYADKKPLPGLKKGVHGSLLYISPDRMPFQKGCSA